MEKKGYSRRHLRLIYKLVKTSILFTRAKKAQRYTITCTLVHHTKLKLQLNTNDYRIVISILELK